MDKRRARIKRRFWLLEARRHGREAAVMRALGRNERADAYERERQHCLSKAAGYGGEACDSMRR